MSTDWDDRFMDLASLVSCWSKDPSTQVGAVLIRDKRVISVGYNGFPPGTSDDPDLYAQREQKYERIVHAEMAALANVNAFGCTLYVTHMPCARCMSQIITSGVSRVVAFYPTPEMMARWPSMRISQEMAEQAGLVIDCRVA
jgi:dCMP deaminase